MSSTVFSQQNPSSINARHPRPINDSLGNNSQRKANRRSLSGTIRNLFRKTSPSPNRTTYNDERSVPAPAPTRPRSPSYDSNRVSTEAPHLKAPTVYWPFGKKKPKPPSTHTKPKKDTRKYKQSAAPPPPREISNPIHNQEYHTSIYGHNFIPRTPEPAHGGLAITQSSTSYETTPKGFRDYTIIDHSRPSEQAVTPDPHMVTSYISDHSRSPSVHRQRLPDSNIEYSYHFDSSPPPISDNEPNFTFERYHNVSNIPSLTTTQILAKQTPLISQTSTSSPPSTINSHPYQWKNTSPLLNHTELRSNTSSGIDTDVPKLHVPSIPYGSTSSLKKPERTDVRAHFDQTYNSLSSITNPVKPYTSYTSTYGSLPDGELTYNGSLSSSVPARINIDGYPGLDAIVQHHIHPNSIYLTERPSVPTSPHRRQRFDASTTTFNDRDQHKQWSTNATNGSTPSPSSLHHHDGYIRPLTPEKPSVQPNVNVIYVDRNRPPSRTSDDDGSEIPAMYRSTTTIYTRDKQKHAGSGEIRTWTARENGDLYANTKPPSSISRSYIEYQPVYPGEERYEVSYSSDNKPLNTHYFNHVNHDKHLSYTQPSTSFERDQIYDQPTRSYRYNEFTQEPFNGITPGRHSEVALRHYTLKQSDSYDGLGILLTADAETRLNHRIRDIEPGSPAERIGLQKNDRIINVNGINVENVDFNDVLLIIKDGLTNNNLQFSVVNESVLH